MKEYIEREKVLEAMEYEYFSQSDIEKIPAADVVERGVLKQIRWERDMAIEQLESYGVGFAEDADCVKVVRCKDCKKYNEEAGWCNEHSSFIDEEGEPCHPWESAVWRMFNRNDFCSYAERREQP